MTASERETLLDPPTKNPTEIGDCVEDIAFVPQVYRKRWWILFVFTFSTCVQGMLWNTWSPITDAVQIAYEWNDSFTAVVLLVYNLAIILAIFPFMFAIELTDLRFGIIISNALSALCCATWILALPTKQYWLIMVGTFLSGICCAFVTPAPSLLSTTWFPVSERTTATSFGLISYLGSSVSFLTGPYISGSNVTASDVKHKDNLSADYIIHLQGGILNVVYFGTCLTVAAFIMAIVYFPPQPLTPPSNAQTKKRVNFRQGIKQLIMNRNFWMLTLAYNLTNGIFVSWISLCSINFRPLGIDEKTSGWIGFIAISIGSVLSVGVSLIADRFKRKMKLFLQIANGCSLAMLVLIACITGKYIQISKDNAIVSLYILCTGLSISINGLAPLYYELACECSFPVDEGLAGAVLTFMNNALGIVFLFPFFNPTLASNTEWLTWTCVGGCALAVPMLYIMKEHFYRLDVDNENEIHASPERHPVVVS